MIGIHVSRLTTLGIVITKITLYSPRLRFRISHTPIQLQLMPLLCLLFVSFLTSLGLHTRLLLLLYDHDARFNFSMPFVVYCNLESWSCTIYFLAAL